MARSKNLTARGSLGSINKWPGLGLGREKQARPSPKKDPEPRDPQKKDPGKEDPKKKDPGKKDPQKRNPIAQKVLLSLFGRTTLSVTRFIPRMVRSLG